MFYTGFNRYFCAFFIFVSIRLDLHHRCDARCYDSCVVFFNTVSGRGDNQIHVWLRISERLRMSLTSAEKQLRAVQAKLCSEADAGSFNLSAVETALARPKVGVGAIVLHPDLTGTDRVLIGERRSMHGAGQWALPGGHLENGEGWAECASRETAEESGVCVPDAKWSMIRVTNDVMAREAAMGEGGQQLAPLHYITLFMACRATHEEIASLHNAEPDKCAGWHWKRWDEVRGLMAAGRLFLPLQHFLEAKGDADTGTLR